MIGKPDEDMAASAEYTRQAQEMQAELFTRPDPSPRARPRVMMHWDDADYDGESPLGNFSCKTCGHVAGWTRASEAEMRRGIPCPKCNCLVEPIGGNVGDHSRCAQYPNCPCGGPAPALKPLFIPLKTEYFEAFKTGTKDTEYRAYGPRWNERTCPVGRQVVLSKGYGTGSRLHGRVIGFNRMRTSKPTAAWEACYGSRECDMACIGIRVTDAISINEVKHEPI